MKIILMILKNILKCIQTAMLYRYQKSWEFAQAREVHHLALNGRRIQLKIARMDDDTVRRSDRQAARVGNGVIDGDVQ